MTEASTTVPGKDWSHPDAQRRIRRRYMANNRLKIYGLIAIFVAIGLLTVLVGSLVYTGYKSFVQTHVTFDVYVNPEDVDPASAFDSDYRTMVRQSFLRLFPDVPPGPQQRQLFEILSTGAQLKLRKIVMADPSLVGSTIELSVPVSDPFDQFQKGEITRDVPEEQRRVNDRQVAWFDTLVEQGRISTPFNWTLFTEADSRFPELAGLKGALVGTFYLLLVTFVLSFPIGIAAAVYLEEFAPKNKWTDLIEININNLAAVPSIVFGLLALAVFLQTFGLPRSAPLVGGMTIALMTLPTIIIATRAALKAVPPSIREAALGIGASKHQVILHHVLPLAMPGILTGTIIGMAQALGETAPLLLIGMNAFMTSAAGGIMDPATTLPTQIYIWADSPERGFLARTSAAILVLLAFLVVMNGLAIYLRRRFERKW
jgi:phosphate transport system permease protein